jgi:hypothetical protein
LFIERYVTRNNKNKRHNWIKATSNLKVEKCCKPGNSQSF